MASLKVMVDSAGCKLNQAEADLWKLYFVRQGYEVVDGTSDETDVGICLVSTCTVTGPADRTSVSLIRRLGRKHPEAEIWVTGCGTALIPHSMEGLPQVTRIIGYKEKESLISNLGYDDSYQTADLLTRSRAFLRIGDGCDRRCSYCIVSRIRGQVRSKPAGEIISELRTLNDAGFGEVVLVALNLGLWGSERGETLAGLLARIEKERTSLPRIRLTSLEPDTITDELLHVIANNDRICRHLHIPLQSGDDCVLEQMQRPYLASQYAMLLDRIKKLIPDANIGTDIITSTPGEDEKSFERTLRFVLSLPIGHLHAFTYSPRPGTPMAQEKRKSNTLPRERTKALREIGKRKSLEYRKRFVGQTRQSVVLSPTRVLTDNYIDVHTSPTAARQRSLIKVRIDEVDETHTRGTAE